MRKHVLSVAVAALVSVAVAAPALAGGGSFSGVVVGRDHGAALVATRAGIVHAVRSTAPVHARVLVRSGHVSVVGRASRATIRGVLVRRTRSLAVVSAAHHLLAVHTDAPAPALSPGDVVTTQVAIGDDDALDEQGAQDVGNASKVEVDATVTAVGQGTVTLSVAGQPLTITLPAGVTVPASAVGTTMKLELSFAAGTPTATPPPATGDDDQAEAGNDDDAATPPSTTTSSADQPAPPVVGGDHHGDHHGGHDGGGDGGND